MLYAIVDSDLEKLCHFEPHRYQEVVTKKTIVNIMINQTLAEAGDLIYQITEGCEICHAH